MTKIDRKMYDNLVRIHEELSAMVTHDRTLIALATHAVRVARDGERPTVRVDDLTDKIEQMYPLCSSDSTCTVAGKWGATGIVPSGHVLVRWKNGAYLGHLRTH